MKIRPLLIALPLLAAASGASAQEPPVRLSIGAGGAHALQPLKDCGAQNMLMLPLGLTVGDVWRASARARWFFVLPYGCDDVGRNPRREGGVDLTGWQPALSLELQRAVAVAERLTLFPGASVGVVRREELARTWHPWVGGILEARPGRSDVVLRLEYGWLRATWMESDIFRPTPPRMVDAWVGMWSAAVVLYGLPM